MGGKDLVHLFVWISLALGVGGPLQGKPHFQFELVGPEVVVASPGEVVTFFLEARISQTGIIDAGDGIAAWSMGSPSRGRTSPSRDSPALEERRASRRDGTGGGRISSKGRRA
jgi:hypothetical protein